jgi:hypothetical protein
MDDITVVAQDDLELQVLMDAVQEFEFCVFWSNTQLNMTKTVSMSINAGSEEKDPPRVTYKQKPIKVFQGTESCRHLGYWATPNGDMTSTKGHNLDFNLVFLPPSLHPFGHSAWVRIHYLLLHTYMSHLTRSRPLL